MNRLTTIVLAAAAALAIAPLALAENPPRAEPAWSPPAPTKPTIDVVGDGLMLLQPKWSPSDAKNISLKVTYAWGGKGPREVAGRDAGTSWSVTFPDRPKPDELAKLDFVYGLSITDADKTSILATIDKVIVAMVDLTRQSGEHGEAGDQFVAEFRKRSSELEKVGEALRAYRTEDGTDGLTETLTSFGLRRIDGAWQPVEVVMINKLHEGTLSRLRANEQQMAIADLVSVLRAKRQLSRDEGPAGENCKKAVDIATPLENPDTDLAALKTCVAALVITMNGRQARAERAAAGKKTDLKKLRALPAKLATLGKAASTISKPSDISEQPDHLGVFSTAWQETRASANDLAPYGIGIDDGYLGLAVNFFEHRLDLANVRASYVASFEGVRSKLWSRAASFTQQQLGQVLIEQGPERRSYEASTGMAYLGGLDEVVMPLMFSYCPFDGCIRRGHVAWDDTELWRHTITLDVGVRAKTIGDEDARDNGDLGLLAGASFNPFYFVRASAGAYFFENSATRNWNTTWYAGVTFDVLHAAELLGFLGLGVPEAPKVLKTTMPAPEGDRP